MSELILKNIKGFPKYKISKCGRVFSTKRGNQKEIKISYSDKYPRVFLYVGGNGERKTPHVHRLIALAWLPNPKNKPYVCHKDDNVYNFDISNLYWGDPVSNVRDCFKNKRRRTGHKNPRSKLSLKQINFIRKNYKHKDKKYNAYEFAKKFNVGRSTIYRVIKSLTYKEYK